MTTMKKIAHNVWCEVTKKCGVQPEDNDEYLASWKHQEIEAKIAIKSLESESSGGRSGYRGRDLLREMGRDGR